MKKRKATYFIIIGLVIVISIIFLILIFTNNSRKSNSVSITEDDAFISAQNEVTLFMKNNASKFPNNKYSLTESAVKIELKFDTHYSKEVYIVHLEYSMPDVVNSPVFEITVDAVTGEILSNYNNYT